MGITKGKWTKTESNSDCTAIGIKSKTALVATVWISKFYDDCPRQKEAEANAQLIVEAPETKKKLDEAVKALKLADVMINNLPCFQGCDGTGTLPSGDQCQWCDEKKILETAIKNCSQ